jgi:capsular polysaccharide biosynthesis protein/FtsZ-binding cell division protein ZapB
MGDSTASELRQLEERRIYVLNPAPDSRRTGGDGVPLGDLISGVWRRRWVIGAITLLGGVLAYASVSFKPTVYEAKAILLVQAPQFSSELKPAPLSVATYQALLNSDATAATVREILVREGDIPEGTGVGVIRSMVTTTIPTVEGFRGANPQLPMIEILASAQQPDVAEKVANTFARVFAQGSLEVATQGRAGSMELIESQYPVTKKMLQNTTVELKNRQDQYADALLELQNSWNRRNHDFKKETQDLVDKPERETRELVLAFADTHKPELTEAKLARQKSRFNSLDSELESNRLSLKGAHHVLVELERLIKREPRYLVVSKAITDSALWNRIGEDSAGRLPEELKDLALREEVPNLIHEKIMGSLIDAQMKVETLKPKQEDLTAEIERVRLEIEELSSEVTRIKLDQFNLGRQRALDLSRLKATRNLDQFNLGRQRALE